MEHTEPSYIFHRWCFISACAAILNRQFGLAWGDKMIYPYQFIILIGPPASRKNTAINFARDLLEESGFYHFCVDTTGKEKFLEDWKVGFDKVYKGEDSSKLDFTISLNDKTDLEHKISEAYVVSPELQNFFGSDTKQFTRMFTDLFDLKPGYGDRFKKQSIYIPNPCVNILGGTTSTIFNELFNDNIMGQGLLSRLILVYADQQRAKYTLPVPLPKKEKEEMIQFFRELRNFDGKMEITPEAFAILDKIYQGKSTILDARLASYAGRRFDHLIKICIVLTASEGRLDLTADVVILANTILVHTESFMSKALGEFGKSKNGEATQIILDLIRANVKNGGITMREIMGKVSQDVNSPNELVAIITKLEQAQRIQATEYKGKGKVYLPIIESNADDTKFTDFSMLWEYDEESQQKLL